MIKNKEIIKFDLENLRRFGVMKVTYRNNLNPTESWNEWKDYDNCSELEKSKVNLRTILPNEIILDLEDEDRIEDIKRLLTVWKVYYYIWKTGSRGYHINLFFKELDKYDKDVRKEYRKIIIDRFKCDISKSSENGLLAIEDKKHFKTGREKILIEKKDGWNVIDMNIMHSVLITSEKNKIKIRESGGSFVDYHIKDELFNYISNNIITDGSRDMVLFKNIALALFNEGLKEDEVKEIITPIIQKNFPGKNINEFMGWFKKAQRGEIDYYNIIELNDWSKKSIGKIFYINDFYTSKEALTHKKSEFASTGAIKYIIDKDDLAKQFIKIQPVYYDESKIWWIWNFSRKTWITTDDINIGIILQRNTSIPLQLYRLKEGTETIRALQTVARENKPKDIKKTWLQFKNKIIDIQTGEEFESSPEYFHSNSIPWELGNSDKTEKIDKLFKEWVVGKGQDETWIKTLYEVVAYSMLPDMPLHRIICLLGEGSNGKGSFIKVIEKFLGEFNISSTEIDTLSKNNFGVSSLYKKLVVVIDEIDKSIFSKTSVLKRISGDSLSRVEFKGKTSFETHLYAKPIIEANQLPETTDKTVGFFRRWLIIDFPHEFPEKIGVIEEITDIEFSNLARKCIKLLQELLKCGNFTNEGNYKQREARYEARSNPIDKFLQNNCDKTDPNGKIMFSVFYDNYLVWLKGENLRQVSKHEVGQSLKIRGIIVKDLYVNQLTAKYLIDVKFKDGFTYN